MFNSLFIGLSGMTAYSGGLRVISNNITNLNSSGFKSSVVSFADLFGEDSNSLSFTANREGSGGGVSLADPQVDYRQGELRQTDRDLDLAIDGSGFLVVTKGDEQYFTRTGSFEVDADGYIILSGTDYKLSMLDDEGRPVPLEIDAYRVSQPEATSRITFADNLSSTATEHSIPDLEVISNDGQPANWTLNFTRDATDPAGEWTLTIVDGDGEDVEEIALRFINGVIDPAQREITVNDGKGRKVVLDFTSDSVTSFSSAEISTLRTDEIDGYESGQITSVTVNEQGFLEIGYSNEQTETVGAIAIADFEEPQKLEQRSGGLFAYDGSDQQFLQTEDLRVGRVVSKRIEASNVDLSAQFGDLILMQRGYQASSQVVSVTNDMVQQLFGLRGR